MAWVRLHDGAISHPKIVNLIDWRNPFCVWVWGLSYCQMHLTDGAIPKGALPNVSAVKTAARLVSDGLWEITDRGYQVHDYLDWNDSRQLVDRRKLSAKERKDEWQKRRATDRNGNGTQREQRSEHVQERAPNTIAGTHNQTKPNQTKERSQETDQPLGDENAHPVARFMRETYPRLYAKARHGAAMRLNEARDFEVCAELIGTYGDRLDVMLEYFLNLPPGKDVLNQPGSPRQFAFMAPICDAELRKHGR